MTIDQSTALPKEPVPLILMVDDSPKNLQLLGSLLRKEGYRIAVASTGQQALTFIRKTTPDLILLDVMMPGMNGFDVCREIKNDPALQSIPVIFLTALSDTDDVVKGFEAGGVDYISKPFKRAELLQRVQTHLRIQKLQRRLMAANAAKDKLFSVIAHDLKGSVNIIFTFVRMMRKEFPNYSDREIQEMLDDVFHRTENTHQLIETLFGWAKTQLDGFKLQLAQINIYDLVQTRIHFLKDMAKEKEIDIHNTISTEIICLADENLIGAVIHNLISNAIKFSYEKGVVTLSAEMNPDEVILSFRDAGMGMPPHRPPTLFQIETNESTPGTAFEKGSGLGLVLCREFIAAHGGRIWAESQEGKGSTFYFTLPRKNVST